MDIDTFAAKFLIEVLARVESSKGKIQSEPELMQLIERAYWFAEIFHREMEKRKRDRS
jgi:hypothetical protein